MKREQASAVQWQSEPPKVNHSTRHCRPTKPSATVMTTAPELSYKRDYSAIQCAWQVSQVEKRRASCAVGRSSASNDRRCELPASMDKWQPFDSVD